MAALARQNLPVPGAWQDSVNHAGPTFQKSSARHGDWRIFRGEIVFAGRVDAIRSAGHDVMAAKAKKQADVEDDETDEDLGQAKAKGKKKLPLKLIGMIAAGVLLLGGVGTAGYMFFGKSGQHAAKKEAAQPAVFVDLPDVLVNLSNSGSDRTQYLKMKITLELPNQSLVDKIKPLMPRVMDTFQTYLRELRPTDLDGSAGLYRLKEALTRRVNEAVAPAHITAVLFKEIVVQ
jgi:flagellar FliL protein